MKTLFTNLEKGLILIIALFFSFNINAADRTFATIAEMLKATDLAKNDKVTITNGVIVDYIAKSDVVLKDISGDASCMMYSWNFEQLQSDRAAFIEKRPDLSDVYSPIKPGDVLNNFVGIVSFSTNAHLITLEPEIDLDNLGFLYGTTIELKKEVYSINIINTTISDLLSSPEKYEGRVVSLDQCISINHYFSSYLVQGNDTLKKFVIYGLNNEDYPIELNIDRALFLDGRIAMNKSDYSIAVFKDFESVKISHADATDTKPFSIDIDMQVLSKENINSKNYIIAKTGEGDILGQYSGMRILLNNVSVNDEAVNVGDIINIKSGNVILSHSKTLEDGSFKSSLLTVGDHTTTIIKTDSVVDYKTLPSDELNKFYSDYEFLPVYIDGYIELTDAATEIQKANNISTANLYAGLDAKERAIPILVDVSLLPSKVEQKWILRGLLNFPLYEDSSLMPVITPLHSSDFISTVCEFKDIESMVAAGEPKSSAIKYSLNCNLFVTGVDTVKGFGNDLVRHLVFVTDGKNCLQLSANNSDMKLNEGDVISYVIGSFTLANPTTTDEVGFASHLSFNVKDIVKSDVKNTIDPVVLTIAQLKSSDANASKFVKIENVTHKLVSCLIGMEMVDRHFIFQGNDSIVVSDNFKYNDKMDYIIGNYYLDGAYTQILPTQIQGSISTDVINEFVDNSVYMSNGVVYADDAEIVVYDILGKVVATGVNSVNLQSFKSQVYLIKTSYDDGHMFMTKLVKR